MPDARAVARKSATHLAKRCCSSAAASGAAGVGAGAVAGPAPAVEPGGCDAGPGGVEAQPATSAAMAAATRAGLMVDCRNEVLLAGCISGFSPVRHGGKPFSRADAPLSYSCGGRAGEHGPSAAANSRGSNLEGDSHATSNLRRMHRGVQRLRHRMPSLRRILPEGTRRPDDGPVHRARHGLRGRLPVCRCRHGARQRTREGHLRAVRRHLRNLRRRMRQAQARTLPGLRQGMPRLRGRVPRHGALNGCDGSCVRLCLAGRHLLRE